MNIIKTKVNIPFFIGAADRYLPHLENLPINFDLNLEFDIRTMNVRQVSNDKLQVHLENSYRLGLQLGVPSDDTDLGNQYVDDFLNLILDKIPKNSSILEIGCGTGYLSFRLKQIGYEVVSVEPGVGYERFWKRYDLDVVNEFFPTDKITQKFDAIVMYTVLEHITSPVDYLKDLQNYLKLDGLLICSVPDCEYEIKNIDPSILIHEHMNFYTRRSLENELKLSNYEAEISHSNFGRSLYSCASPAKVDVKNKIDVSEFLFMENFVKKIADRIDNTHEKLSKIYNEYGLSVYCPARLLNVLDSEWDIKFYDDSEYLHGRYLFPFKNPVMSRCRLLSDPSPEVLVIASVTFGKHIQLELIESGYKGRIILMEDLMKEIL